MLIFSFFATLIVLQSPMRDSRAALEQLIIIYSVYFTLFTVFMTWCFCPRVGIAFDLGQRYHGIILPASEGELFVYPHRKVTGAN